MANLSEQFYEYVTQDDEERACSTIPDSDCHYVAKNFSLNVANGTLTKLAEKIISPNLTLPWIFSFLGAPAILIGALVPVRNFFSLVPQLFVAGKIRAKKIRKTYWTGAALVQAMVMLASGVLVFWYQQSWVTWCLLGLLALFSIASGVASVAFKDVAAKTVPKGERGQMLSYRSTFGGLLALVAGALLIFVIRSQGDQIVYAVMFLVTSILWFVAALIFYRIQELPGATKGGRNPIEEFKSTLSVLKTDVNFRNFLITRALLMAIPLSQPFYVVISKDLGHGGWSQIGYLILISGFAQVISSPFWGRFADDSPTRMMRWVSLLSIATSIYTSLFLFNDHFLNFYWFLPVFFVHGLAYTGARLSRKTYLIDYAPDDDRPTYVSLANTLIGSFTLIAAGFGVVAQYFGLIFQLYFFVLLLLGCIGLSFKLKSV
ncbi:MFS transporter [Yeosuana marina]|uniref:MFS transporter n=1 Tax=Yeosuana marina TaxID=1565536 RepID=UPI0030C7F461